MKNKYGLEPNSVNFFESIGICLKKYFVFEGRASRSELWYFFLVYWVGGSILEVTAKEIESEPLELISLALMVIGFIPMLSVGCRRLHDINKSGWWQLIPIYNFILWAQESTNISTKSVSEKSLNETETLKSTFKKNDLTDELEDLQELYEDGTLSEEQFKKAKKKLLK